MFCIEDAIISMAFGFPTVSANAMVPVLPFPCTKITSCLTLVLLISFETVLLSTVSDCTKSFYVHWNTTNPM